MDRLMGPGLLDGAGLAEFLAGRSTRQRKFRGVSVATPYLTDSGLERLLALLAEPKEGQTDLRLLVRRDAVSVATGALSLTALRMAMGRAVRNGSSTEIRSTPRLHAKIYLLEPGHVCAIGSSNLTGPGLDGGNQELNAVWAGSAKAFASVQSHFQRLWDEAQPIEYATVDEWQGWENLSTLRKLRSVFDSARQITALPVLSKTEEQHYSYQVFTRLSKKMDEGASWKKIVSWFNRQSKGIKDQENRLEALVVAGLLRREGETVRLTKEGQEVARDPAAAYIWLKRCWPLVDRVLQEVVMAPEGATYRELTETLSVERKQIEHCMWWIRSLGLVRREGGGGGVDARWYPADAKRHSPKRSDRTGVGKGGGTCPPLEPT